MRSLGLYIHIPFCATKCSYCDFPSWAGCMGHRPAYVQALVEEITQRGEQMGRPYADTVFIGGGTPSLLTPPQMEQVLQALRRSFCLDPAAEFSCEANPGALSAGMLKVLMDGGVNRLSLVAQAADAALLQLLGRRHTWYQVEEAVAAAREAGFTNINLDLMLGIPTQTMDIWRQTLEQALALQPTHLSCYGLIVEEGTILAARIEAGVWTLPDEDTERRLYDYTLTRLEQAGFQQYEISNFARPGRQCLHNLHCWQRQDYLGFGCAAHGLEGAGTLRRQNPSTLAGYLAGEQPRFQPIGAEEAMFESLMLGLRLTRGLDLEAFEAMHGQRFEAVWEQQAENSLSRGLTALEQGHFRLTRQGMDVMNTVLLDFM
ncbi:MAG: radical SAM family heme chaperone HemW [Clostridiales bacterium]|nr:radical SAM family heme chaperone HemW [Clostridiales bacterium]